MATAIAPAMMVGQAGLSFLGAQAANRGMESALGRQRDATTAARQQTAQQAAIERRRQRSQHHAIQHRLRVAAGEAGTGMGGSFGALSRQADLDLQTNLGTVQMNEANRQQTLALGFADRQAQMAGNMQNPILAGLMGGVQGLSTGLQIGDAVGGMLPDSDPLRLPGSSGSVGGPGTASRPSFGGSAFA